MVKTIVRSLPRADEHVDTVILADGSYPSGLVATSILENANKIVCCDGAANKLVARGKVPHAIVGDCDSISDELRQKYSDRIVCVKEQETNDLTKTVRFCVEQGVRNITIMGATGKRSDHSIGNIGLLAEYIKLANLDSVRILTESGVFEPITNKVYFESYKGQQVSIFCPDSRAKITTFDLLYPLHNTNLNGWWQGTLNESMGDQFAIECDGVAIIYREL